MAVIPLLIKEKTLESSYTKHDQLYKELISNFFEEFRRMIDWKQRRKN